MPKEKKLYALLVAINEYQYPIPALNGCVNDLHNFEAYLQQETSFDLKAKVLTNKNATRSNILKEFKDHLNNATADDVILFYYSGHGTREEADLNLWNDVDDGKLECVVAYNGADEGSDFLIADKEFRFLINQLAETEAHILTIFDCCHSGGITRGLGDPEEVNRRETGFQGRMSQTFPMREWKDFIFANDIDKNELKANSEKLVFKQGKHVQLSACANDQSAFEANGEGVFTKNLIQILNRTQGQVSYFDLRSRLKYYIKNQFEQTPKIHTVGESSMAYAHFLNKPGKGKPLYSNIVFDEKIEEWTMDMGAIHGVTPQAEAVEIHSLDGKEKFTATLKKIQANESILELSRGAREGMKEADAYQGFVDGYLSAPISVFVNDQNCDVEAAKEMEDTIKSFDGNMLLVNDEKKADYTVQVANDQYFITNTFDPNRPLVVPTNDISENDSNEVIARLSHIAQWAYVKNLHSSNEAIFQKRSPVEIEFFAIDAEGVAHKIDINNEEIIAHPGEIKVKVTNTFNRKLNVACLYLSSDFGVNPDFLNPTVKPLEQGESVILNEDFLEIGMDDVDQFFNNKASISHFQFLINTDDFDVDRMRMDPLPTAIELLQDKKRNPKGVRVRKSLRLDQSGWTTRCITLKIPNPNYNKISEFNLKTMLESHAASFAFALYLEQDATLSNNFQMKEGVELVKEAGTRGLLSDVVILIANSWARSQRDRQFKANKIAFPDRPLMVSEGDSWFQHPHPSVKDTIDHLMQYYNIHSLGAAGDRLRNFFEKAEYAKAIEKLQPQFLLLSGGGNDILGEKFKDFLANNVQQEKAERQPELFMTKSFYEELEKLSQIYESIFSHNKARHPNLKIICHGYDYIIPLNATNKGWLGRYMIAKGIQKQSTRENLIRKLIDMFNEKLRTAAKKYDNAFYVDLRTTVKRNQWYDEIHPNSNGFQDVAVKIMRVIDQELGQRP